MVGSMIELTLPLRTPFAAAPLLRFLAARAVAGIEEATTDTYRRSLPLPGGGAVMELAPAADGVRCRLWLTDDGDRAAATALARRLFDLDSDPDGVDSHLAADPLLAPSVAAAPGLRSPGHVDGCELIVRAVLGQQVSVKAATTHLGRLVDAHGIPLDHPVGTVTHLFPPAEVLAEASLDALAVPTRRRDTVRSVAAAIADGSVPAEPGAEPSALVPALLAIAGIGPWTAAYVAMRLCGDPDVLMATDLGVRRAAQAMGLPELPAPLQAHAERWRPWRSYATHHLWQVDAAVR